MRIINLEQTNQTKQIKKEKKWGWILICFFIFSAFKNKEMDETHLFSSGLFLLSIIIAPFFYYWIKPKLIEKTKDYVIGLAVVLIFIFAIGFLGGLGDAIIIGPTTNKAGQDVLEKIVENKAWRQDLKVRWDKTQSDIIDDTNLPSQYTDNIYYYRELQKLNDEKYNKLNTFYSEVVEYLNSNSDFDINKIYDYNKKLRDANDELITAKINYFQVLLDDASFFEIEAKRAVVNQKIEVATTVQNESSAIFADLDKALAEISRK